MTDNEFTGYGLVNHFKLDDGDLVFAEQNSSNFIYVKVKDGEKFHCAEEVYKPIDETTYLYYIDWNGQLVALAEKNEDTDPAGADKQAIGEILDANGNVILAKP